jgi:hypothetical protein
MTEDGLAGVAALLHRTIHAAALCASPWPHLCTLRECYELPIRTASPLDTDANRL